MDTSLSVPSLRLLNLVNETRAENCSILIVAELSPSLWVDIELEEESQVGVEHRLVDKVVRSEAGRVTDPARPAIHQLVGRVEAVLVDLGLGREHLQHLVRPAPAAAVVMQRRRLSQRTNAIQDRSYDGDGGRSRISP